ncbi:epoxide hydrolase [Sphingomonas sp. YL-JM2C]
MTPLVEPFVVAVPDATIARIRQRVAEFDWAGVPDAGGWSAGISLSDMRRLTRYWLDRYDWRDAEAKLNRFPQYRARVDGEEIHFYHIRATVAKRRLLILTHGWPGSVFEFLGLIEQLAALGVDLLVPSLPGYGFSAIPRHPIGPRRIAALWRMLAIDFLGYGDVVAQGGDWGATVSAWLAYDHPDICAGLHLNMVLVQAADAKPESEEERLFASRMKPVMVREGGYAAIQRTRPQTLGFALSDSPVGMAAWIAEKFAMWSDLPMCDGAPNLWARYTEEQLLTNIMIYLVTRTATSAGWLYKGRYDEESLAFPCGGRVTVPTAVAAFPEPQFAPPPRSLVEKSYDLVKWTAMPRGGHFAALEEPASLQADIAEFLAMLPSPSH